MGFRQSPQYKGEVGFELMHSVSRGRFNISLEELHRRYQMKSGALTVQNDKQAIIVALSRTKSFSVRHRARRTPREEFLDAGRLCGK